MTVASPIPTNRWYEVHLRAETLLVECAQYARGLEHAYEFRKVSAVHEAVIPADAPEGAEKPEPIIEMELVLFVNQDELVYVQPALCRAAHCILPLSHGDDHRGADGSTWVDPMVTSAELHQRRQVA